MKASRPCLVILGVLLLSLYAVTPAAAGRKPVTRENRDRPTHEASNKQMRQLPNYGDPEVAKKLKCSSCKCLTDEIYGELMKLHKLRHGKPKEFELVAITEGICDVLKDDYGLLMRNNKPTTDFSRNKAISRMQGHWINSFIETRCGEIISDHEDDMLSEYAALGDLAAFQRRFCGASCDKEQLEKEEL